METATQPTATPTLHTPFGALTLSQMGNPLVRLLLQGFSGTGKTTSALTFPNPVVLDFDNNLGGHRHRADVTVIPFWNDEWIKQYMTQYKLNPSATPKYEVIFHWLKTEGTKLTRNQTLIPDSWTAIQNLFDSIVGQQKFYTAAGKEDGFKFWKLKKEFCLQLCEVFKSLRCNVVVTCHETPDRDEEGRVTGKLKPLVQGSFADELAAHFTDYYRQIVKEDEKKNPQYLWQVRGDNKCNCKTTTIRNLKITDVTVPADYKSFGITTNQ